MVFGFAALGFLLIGIICAVFPERVKKYDERMTRLIKDESQYITFTRVFGFFFIFLSFAAGFIFLLFIFNA